MWIALLLLTLALPASGAPGRPKGPGGSGDGAGTPAGRYQLAFNNATTARRGVDGVLHSVVSRDGSVVYTRAPPDGAPVEIVLGKGRFAAIGSDGHDWLLVSWSTPAGVHVSRSVDGGRTWSADARLGGEFGRNPSVVAWSAAEAHLARVAWHQPDSPGKDATTSSVYTATWNGAAWSAPERLDDETGKSEFVSLAERNGQIWATWRVSPEAGTEERPEVRIRSFDDRATWGPIEVPGLLGRDPSVCVTSTRIVIGWQGRQQVFAASRPVEGGPWSAPVPLGPGAFASVSCAESGTVSVAWESFSGPRIRDDSVKVVGLAVSRDHGATFTPRVVAGGRAQLVFANATIAPDGMVDVRWIDREADAPGWERVE